MKTIYVKPIIEGIELKIWKRKDDLVINSIDSKDFKGFSEDIKDSLKKMSKFDYLIKAKYNKKTKKLIIYDVLFYQKDLSNDKMIDRSSKLKAFKTTNRVYIMPIICISDEKDLDKAKILFSKLKETKGIEVFDLEIGKNYIIEW